MSRITRFASRPVAAIAVSAITLLIAGGVILTSTPMGCGPAQKLGLKGVASHCGTSRATALKPTPFPTVSGLPAYTPPASAPYSPPASEPYNPPASGPYYPPASGYPPGGGPASGSYVPFAPPPSGGGAAPPAVTLSCRLPVFNGPPGSGGFIVYPGGTYIADPTSSVVIPSPSPGQPSPPPAYGPGYTGLSYDFAYRKWLPVPFSSVSPDGARYAHVATTSIYVENVANGSTIELGEGHSWNLTDVENSGVYATINQQAGLWYLPYSGAAATEVTASGYWSAGSHGAAYGMTASALPQGLANTIIKVDLRTGAITNWFYRDFASSSVVGLDNQGHPLIAVNYFPLPYSPSASEMWVTTAANTGAPLFGSFENLYSYSSPVGDSHGVWFVMNYSVPYQSSVQGLALYVPGSGLYWMSSLGTQLAGGCV